MQCAPFVKSPAIPVFLHEIVLYTLGKNMIFEVYLVGCGIISLSSRVWYSVHSYYFQAWFKFEKVYCIVSKVVFWLLNLDSKQHYHDSSTVKKHVVSCQNASGKCSRQCRGSGQDTCRSWEERGWNTIPIVAWNNA